jgi:putative ABC transport system permease protein
MMRQMFRLVWNRKKRNFLLITEVFFSFLVLFYVGTLGLSSVLKYNQPLGFSYENVWLLKLGFRAAGSDVSKESLKNTLTQLEMEMRSHEQIAEYSWINGCVPYTGSTWATILKIDGRSIESDIVITDDRFSRAMNLGVVEGRWFDPQDNAALIKPIVINSEMKEQLVGGGSVLGYKYTSEEEEYVVVGVIDTYRFRGDFENHRAVYFERSAWSDTASDMPEDALLRVREGTDVRFEERLLKQLSAIAPGWNLKIETLSDMRSSYIKDKLLGIVTIATIAIFLVFNVALGLFGVLWYSINRRRPEIGLRRALGADRRDISWQILGESLALATLAIVAGLFVAAQVPVLGLDSSISGHVYVIGMVMATLSVYLVVLICALYPSLLASRIQPAQALHDE